MTSQRQHSPLQQIEGGDVLAQLIDAEALTLLLVRHGQPGGNAALDGYVGPALSDVGQQQAQSVARRLAPLPLDHIYCSDMARSYQTALAVSRRHPDVPFDCLADIREISTFQVRGFPPARTTKDRRGRREQRERVARFAAHVHKVHRPGQLVAVIAHNGLNGMLLSELDGTDYRRGVRFVCCHSSVSLANVSPQPPRMALRLLGCTRHLPRDLVTAYSATPPR